MLLAARALGEEAKNTTLTVNGQQQQGQLIRVPVGGGPAGRRHQDRQHGRPPGRCRGVGGRRSADAGAAGLQGLHHRAHLLHDGWQAGGPEERDRRLEPGQAERALRGGGEGVFAETGGRILLVDRLPAGLEIENPRIVDFGDIKSLAWLKTTVQPEHTDFRDARFVAAFDFFGSRPGRRGDSEETGDPQSSATVAYVVRAVTPGSFVHPAATVEDMYRPDRFARTASGRLEVTARE